MAESRMTALSDDDKIQVLQTSDALVRAASVHNPKKTKNLALQNGCCEKAKDYHPQFRHNFRQHLC
jgi:hypothetical protein